MSIPVLLAVLHGTIGNNIINLYSSSMALLSLDAKIARWKTTLAVGVISMGVVIWFIASSNFAQSFNEWITSLVVWLSPWAAITLVDYLGFRRGKVDVSELYRPPSRTLLPDLNVPGIIAFVVGIAAGWSFEYGPVPRSRAHREGHRQRRHLLAVRRGGRRPPLLRPVQGHGPRRSLRRPRRDRQQTPRISTTKEMARVGSREARDRGDPRHHRGDEVPKKPARRRRHDAGGARCRARAAPGERRPPSSPAAPPSRGCSTTRSATSTSSSAVGKKWGNQGEGSCGRSCSRCRRKNEVRDVFYREPPRDMEQWEPDRPDLELWTSSTRR